MTVNTEKIWYELARDLEDQLRAEQRARRVYVWMFRGALLVAVAARFL